MDTTQKDSTLKDFEQELRVFSRLFTQESDVLGKLSVLKKRMEFLLKSYDEVILTCERLALNICTTTFFDETFFHGMHDIDAKYQEIVDEACTLELPDAHVGGNPKERREKWLKDIREYLKK
jgi:hypothetical protein